ncbi:hypothetical protein QT979_15890 [Microcoleus sp. w2-18bC1]|uniref:hypothetical protein n=1 Tax=unclassified Microcoleus TaxID=2642155 RepID=UPI002FD719FD
MQQSLSWLMCRWLVELPGGCDQRAICWPRVFFSKSGDRSGSNLKAIALHQQSLNPIPIEDYRLQKIPKKALGF